MNLPPLRLIDHTHFYTEGEVVIDPSAAIAPGVIFQAANNSRIVIRAGVCVGAGTVLNARSGTLSLEEGASLGAGVLVVGQGRIGAHACIGSAATLINPAIAPGEIVPPGSLLGDTSRRVAIEVEVVSSSSSTAAPEPPSVQPTPVKTSEHESEAISDVSEPTEAAAPPPSPHSDEVSPTTVGVQVYGQGQVRQLLEALFPHRQPLNNTSEQPPEADRS